MTLELERLVRRSPVQGRSRERRDRILAAARHLVVEGGSAQGITTRDIAQRAGVPIGSVYYLFPHANAIFHAVLSEELSQMQAMAQATDRSAPAGGAPDSTADWRAALAQSVDRVARFLFERPHIRHLARALRNDPEFEAINDADNEGWQESSAHILKRLLPDLDGERADLVARLTVRISEALLNEAGLSQDALRYWRVVDELKLVLCSYVGALLETDHARLADPAAESAVGTRR